MTKGQYLDKLDKLMDTLVKISEKVTEPRDCIEILIKYMNVRRRKSNGR